LPLLPARIHENANLVYTLLVEKKGFGRLLQHHRFDAELDNILTVVSFFESRLERAHGDVSMSVNAVLDVITAGMAQWDGHLLKVTG